MGMPNPAPLVTKMLTWKSGYFSLGDHHTFGFPLATTRNIMDSLGYRTTKHVTYANKKSKPGYKAKIHNLLCRLWPSFVSNWQYVKAGK